MKKTIGIIGYGNMGSAIAERARSEYDILVFDQDPDKTRDCGLPCAPSAGEAAQKTEVLVLAVKPQDFSALLENISSVVSGKLVISIAAGITTGYIEKRLQGARVVRVMPNMAAKIGRGMNCLCKGASATEEDLGFAIDLFSKLGATLVLKEEMMDAATAVSGSGPGFFFALIAAVAREKRGVFCNEVFIPKLGHAAFEAGFTQEQCHIISEVTCEGSLELLNSSGLSPEELCRRVASKGGTTEAGLKVLNNNADNLVPAVQAAIKRSKELSKKE